MHLFEWMPGIKLQLLDFVAGTPVGQVILWLRCSLGNRKFKTKGARYLTPTGAWSWDCSLVLEPLGSS